MSQVFTTPAESLEIATPSLTCRLTDSIGDGVGVVEVVSAAAGFVDEILVFQNLTVLSSDAEMREDGNMRELMSSVCPMRVSMR